MSRKYIAKCTSFLSLAMIILVMAGQIVQYHHHDERDEICLCLNPSSHCHDSHHDDCNHHQDAEDCSLHFEDSIVVDANDHNLAFLAFVEILFDYYSFSDVGCDSQDFSHDLVLADLSPGFYEGHSLRAPPVYYYNKSL